MYRPYLDLAALQGKQQRYVEAIEAAEKGLSAAQDDHSIPESENKIIRRYWMTEMLGWHADLRNTESAFKLSREILKSFPDQYDVATRYTTLLCEEKHYDTAMRVFQDASEVFLEDKGHTRLTDWVSAPFGFHLCEEDAVTRHSP